MANDKFKLVVLLFLLLMSPFLLTVCPREKQNKPPKTERFPINIRADFPTDLVFTQDTLFFTEKGGALKVLKTGQEKPKTLINIKVPDLGGTNEAGLLGIALSPKFSENSQIFLYHTYSRGSQLFNKVIRIEADEPKKKPVIILDDIQGGEVHNGGKLAFGPDGNLYIATGETNKKTLAQDISSLNGKILRIKPDGKIPLDNPFNNAIWSLGHRNIFGMTFDTSGRLFVTENGPEINDEVNEITKGANFGWPEVTGFSDKFKQPLIVYKEIVAPTGIIFYSGDRFPNLKDDLVFGDFVDGNLHRLSLTDHRAVDKIVAESQEHINALAQTKNGLIYIAVRNRIIRLNF